MKCLITALLGVLAAAQTYEGCPGERNESPVTEFEPQLIKTIHHGQLWRMETAEDNISLVRLWGSAYDMGFAYGELLGKEIQEQNENWVKYGEMMTATFLKNYLDMGPLKAKLIYDKFVYPLVYKVLDLNWRVAEPYIPQRWMDEMQGIVDGSGGVVDYIALRNANMFPELTRAACTILGAWGPSTDNGSVYHLRALDWASDAPMM